MPERKRSFLLISLITMMKMMTMKLMTRRDGFNCLSVSNWIELASNPLPAWKECLNQHPTKLLTLFRWILKKARDDGGKKAMSKFVQGARSAQLFPKYWSKEFEIIQQLISVHNQQLIISVHNPQLQIESENILFLPSAACWRVRHSQLVENPVL